MGPRTAYSTFFTVGFMVSMVNTLARDIIPFSDIFSLGSPRRVVLKLDKALPGEEEEQDKGGEVSERNRGPTPPRCGPPPPCKNSATRPGLIIRRSVRLPIRTEPGQLKKKPVLRPPDNRKDLSTRISPLCLFLCPEFLAVWEETWKACLSALLF
ncbi:hypothetical protein XENOCAPTIV_006040 [Xenoophorus captivus]|uniref:Uncharacterized protein n=1 Tax=Xenoophorus captivus TaxID=1517983 RepID=A0ABV0QLB6_9TELE